MASSIEMQYKISGVPQLQRRMSSLTEKVATRGVRSSLKVGAERIADAARSNARAVDDPATAENIAQNITVQHAPRIARAAKGEAFRVGILGGAKKPGAERVGYVARKLAGTSLPGGETWYWRFVEFGTSRSRARPFMRPAMEAEAGYAAEDVAAALEKFLDHAASEVSAAP